VNSYSTSTLQHAFTPVSQMEEIIRSVMQSLIDCEEGFQKLVDEVIDPRLRRYFREESSMRAQFRSELEAVLLQEGMEEIHEGGSVAGGLRRAWGELKSALGGDDHILLVTAEEGDNQAMEAYRKAFEMDLPFPVQQLLAAQVGHVEASRDYLRAAHDSTRQTSPQLLQIVLTLPMGEDDPILRAS
jgi:uncharacterized protein (TIGR02284 family)